MHKEYRRQEKKHLRFFVSFVIFVVNRSVLHSQCNSSALLCELCDKAMKIIYSGKRRYTLREKSRRE